MDTKVFNLIEHILAYTATKIPLCTYVFMYLQNLLTNHAVHLHMLEVGKQVHKILSKARQTRFVHLLDLCACGHLVFIINY